MAREATRPAEGAATPEALPVQVSVGALGLGLFGGIITLVLALLPGLGPAIAAVTALVVALDLASWQPVAVLLFGVLVCILDGALFVPRIYGHVMQLPMFVVLISTLLGADLMGVWGAMIASPVAVALQIVLRDQFRRGLETGSPK